MIKTVMAISTAIGGLLFLPGPLTAGLSDFLDPGNDLSRADLNIYLPRRTFRADPRFPVAVFAGDYDNDARPEVLVAVHDVSRVYLFRGSELEPGRELDAIDTAGIIFATDDDYVSGWDCDARGDIDGDGLPDILIGAGGLNEGRGGAFLILGRVVEEMLADGVDYYWFDDGSDHLEFIGGGTDDTMGYTVAWTADIDGDGRSEILIGGEEYSSGSSRPKVYLFYSGNVLALAEDSHRIDLAAADIVFTGYWDDDYFPGFRCDVAGAGDVDGDGYGDILVGSPAEEDARGRTYLYLGETLRSWEESEITPDDADYVFVGEAAGDRSGMHVAGGGDVDGDGRSDILIGATRSSFSSSLFLFGKAYLIFGAALDHPERTRELASADCSFFCRSWLDYGLSSLAFADDIDGDGASEVLMGNRRAWLSAGMAALFTSSEINRSIGEGTRELYEAEAQLQFRGEAVGDEAGSWAAALGDLNGDGIPEFLIASPGCDRGPEDPESWDGKVSVVFSDIPSVVYVDGEVGTPGGPGTEEEPFDTIGRGLTAADIFNIPRVVVRGWIYDEVAELKSGIEVTGELKRYGSLLIPPILAGGGQSRFRVEGGEAGGGEVVGARLKNFLLINSGIRLERCRDSLIAGNMALQHLPGPSRPLEAGEALGNEFSNNVFYLTASVYSRAAVQLGSESGGNRLTNNTVHAYPGHKHTYPGYHLPYGVFLAGESGLDAPNELRNNIIEYTEVVEGQYAGIYAEVGSSALLDYNKLPAENRGIAGMLAAGAGNIIGGDPLFVLPMPLGPHYGLQPGSPCRNTGDPGLLNRDGSRSTMGAYGGPDPLDFRD